MLAGITKLDATITTTRPVWAWLGQLAVIVLGVHLAADRLDDQVHALLVATPIAWPTPETPLVAAAWLAMLLEIVVVLRAAAALLLTPQQPDLSWAAYKRNLSVDAVVLPLFWAPVAVGGAWVAGMAVEDTLAPYQADVAHALAWIVMAVVGWRLGWTGWKRVVGSLEPPKRRTEGWLWAAPLLIVAFTAAKHGLPIWGWMS